MDILINKATGNKISWGIYSSYEKFNELEDDFNKSYIKLYENCKSKQELSTFKRLGFVKDFLSFYLELKKKHRNGSGIDDTEVRNVVLSRASQVSNLDYYLVQEIYQELTYS